MDVIIPPHPGVFLGGNGAHSPPGNPQKMHAIRTYAEAFFPAPYLIGILLELVATRSGFRVLSEYVTRRGDAYTARTGLPFPRPISTRHQFNATWRSLIAPLALSHPPYPAWNVPTPRRRVVVGPYGFGHNTCNPRQPCASPLTGHVPSLLWCQVTGTRGPVGVGRSYRLFN